jgi:hypothetical protein
MDLRRDFKLNRKKIGIDLARYIKGRGPNVNSLVKYAKGNNMILSPRAYEFESYFIFTDDSNVVSAAKKMGHSHLHVLIVGGKEDAIIEIKRIFRDFVNESNFGAKEMTKTVAYLENMWNRLFTGTSIEDNFYDTFSEAVEIPKSVIIRAIKTREPTGITKDDLLRQITQIREGRTYIERIDKLSETFCLHCGSVEKLNLTGVDRTIIPHYIQAAAITKINHLLQNVPFSAREGTLKLIRDGVQNLISKSIKEKYKG